MLMRASRMTPPLLLLLLLLLCGERCEAAVWADEIGLDIVTPSLPSQPSSPSPTSPPPATNSAVESSDRLSNETRQLESIAFPVGIAIGAIGAAIWPSIFPGVTTTTTTQSSADSFGDSSVDSSGDIISISGTTSTTEKSTTTTFEPRTLLENYPDCGVKGSSTKVVGGTQIVENEYPWLCSLKYRGSHICGMTLLSGPPHSTILVGAAHCYSVGDSVDAYTITCGEHSLQANDKYQVTLQVTQVIVHPKYVEASTSGFDIAVYKVNEAPLDRKLVPGRLWPVCLPDITKSYSSEKTWVAGWGITKTKFIRGSKIQVKGIPDIARHTSVKVVSCEDSDQFDYPKGLICASEKGQDSCQGDSGGPLIARSDLISTRGDVRYSWIGIVSFGVGCAEPGYPGAYTRSACFLGFIAEQFNLKADFPQPGDHPGWSTDCQAGASRRSSAASRYKSNKTKKKKNKKKNKRKHSRESSETASYIDRSDLITIEDYQEDEGGEDKEENNKKKNGRVVEKNEELSVLTLLNKYLIKPFLPQ